MGLYRNEKSSEITNFLGKMLNFCQSDSAFYVVLMCGV